MASRSFTLRLPLETHVALVAEAERSGRARAEVVKEALEARLALSVPLVGSTAGGPSGASASADLGGSVDLAVWLAGRVGMPRSLMRQRIREGRVRVGGVVVPAGKERVPLRLVGGGVELDGEPV